MVKVNLTWSALDSFRFSCGTCGHGLLSMIIESHTLFKHKVFLFNGQSFSDYVYFESIS